MNFILINKLNDFSNLCVSIFARSDLSLANLAYLTSDQALADASNFIQATNIRYNFNANQKWIIFGGSYAGSLALWLVEKYPNLAYGAISSSGPVKITMDFSGINVVR